MSVMDDVKVSFGYAKNNMLSFLLAIFGMLILVAILIFIVISPLLLMAWLANPSDPEAFGLAISAYFQGLTGFFGSNPLAGLFGGGAIGLLFLIPIFAVGTWIFSAIYGMSNEIIMTGGTHAESAFGYLRKNVVSSLGAGVLWSLVLFVPLWLVGLGATALTGFTTLPAGWGWPIGIITFLYVYIVGGFLMLHLPASADGLGALDSLKTSFRLTKENLGRVFGAWTIFIALIAVFFAPIALYAVYFGSPGVIDIGFAITIAWAAIGAFVLILFALPALFLTFTRIYLSVTGKLPQQGSPATPTSPDL
ncbi:MAG: hypothetical protein KGD60_12080 [Candidatus Thorarchaeota archaeon]|nr:hypothetical protein [Candidatus Thorarchaeota archaeon]